jgi:hypothetical protein
MGDARMFPILLTSYKLAEHVVAARAAGLCQITVAIPWGLIAPHARQAWENHTQTLERLAQRGGLSRCEAVAVLENRPWRKMDQVEAERRLAELIAATANAIAGGTDAL